MAHYEILVQESRARRCSKGRRHLQQVRCEKELGAPVVTPVERLLQMVAAGDTFTLVDADNPSIHHAGAVEPCACGKGYVLKPEGVVYEFRAG